MGRREISVRSKGKRYNYVGRSESSEIFFIKQGADTGFALARVPKEFKIPSNTITQYYLKVPAHLNGNFVFFEPNHKYSDKVIFPALLAKVENCRIPVSVINPHDVDCSIGVNSIVGCCSLYEVSDGRNSSVDPHGEFERKRHCPLL